jgi:hypothetical protein
MIYYKSPLKILIMIIFEKIKTMKVLRFTFLFVLAVFASGIVNAQVMTNRKHMRFAHRHHVITKHFRKTKP